MMSIWWVIVLLLAERLFEVRLAAKNRAILLQRGGQEYYPESYRSIVLMHVMFFVCLLLESYPWRVPLDALTLFGLVAILMLQLGRYWCVWSLQEYWNTRIILVPGASVIRRGPYRLMRHPNYLVVTLEFAVIPLLARAPLTLLFFSITNLFVLRRRIQLEEQALREHTDYSRIYPEG